MNVTYHFIQKMTSSCSETGLEMILGTGRRFFIPDRKSRIYTAVNVYRIF